MKIEGNVFKFGSNIDTDQIYPGRYVELTEKENIAKHALEGADPSFVKEMTDGDIVVAASNFGCGSSREHAVMSLLYSGVGAVIATSFARIFYRNALNLGLPLITFPGIEDLVEKGDTLLIDLDEGYLEINGTERFDLSDEYKLIRKAVEADGLVNLFINKDVDMKAIFAD